MKVLVDVIAIPGESLAARDYLSERRLKAEKAIRDR
jgi:hypothetical protein